MPQILSSKKGEEELLPTGLFSGSVGLSVLTYVSNRLYHKTNYNSPQRTIELLASSFLKPKYLETRK